MAISWYFVQFPGFYQEIPTSLRLAMTCSLLVPVLFAYMHRGAETPRSHSREKTESVFQRDEKGSVAIFATLPFKWHPRRDSNSLPYA